MTPIDLPRLLLMLAKAEYYRADKLEDGCVDAVLLVKTHNGIRVDIFEDWEDENVNDNTSREASRPVNASFRSTGTSWFATRLFLGYENHRTTESSQFTILLHSSALAESPGGLAYGEQGTTDWFFPVALFEELVLWEGTSASICDGPTGLEDNYAPGIEGFIEAIVDVVAESKTLANPRDFQLKP
jgi:hypothetical protein